MPDIESLIIDLVNTLSSCLILEDNSMCSFMDQSDIIDYS